MSSLVLVSRSAVISLAKSQTAPFFRPSSRCLKRQSLTFSAYDGSAHKPSMGEKIGGKMEEMGESLVRSYNFTPL